MHVKLFEYKYVCTYVFITVYMSIQIYMYCKNISTLYHFICLYVKYVYIHVYLFIYIYIYICSHARTHTHIYIYMCVCMCVHVCVYEVCLKSIKTERNDEGNINFFKFVFFAFRA